MALRRWAGERLPGDPQLDYGFHIDDKRFQLPTDLAHLAAGFPHGTISNDHARRVVLSFYPSSPAEWFDPTPVTIARPTLWDGKTAGTQRNGQGTVKPAHAADLAALRIARAAHVDKVLETMCRYGVIERVDETTLRRVLLDENGRPSEGQVIVTADGDKVPVREWPEYVAAERARRLDEDPTEQRLRKAEAAAAAALAEVEQLRAAAR